MSSLHPIPGKRDPVQIAVKNNMYGVNLFGRGKPIFDAFPVFNACTAVLRGIYPVRAVLAVLQLGASADNSGALLYASDKHRAVSSHARLPLPQPFLPPDREFRTLP